MTCGSSVSLSHQLSFLGYLANVVLCIRGAWCRDEDACELDTGKNVDDNGRVRQLELHVSIGGGYTSLTCLNRRDVVTSTVTGDGVTQLTLYPNRRTFH